MTPVRTQVQISHEGLSHRGSRRKTARVSVVAGVEVGIHHGAVKYVQYRPRHYWVGNNSIYRPAGSKRKGKGVIHHTGVSF